MDAWNPHSTKMASSPKFNQVENDCLIKQVIVNPGTVLYLVIIHHVLHHVLFIWLVSYNFWGISLWPIYAKGESEVIFELFEILHPTFQYIGHMPGTFVH